MKGTLVDINEKRKGYKCYILEWKKMVISRDIIIEEKKISHTMQMWEEMKMWLMKVK